MRRAIASLAAIATLVVAGPPPVASEITVLPTPARVDISSAIVVLREARRAFRAVARPSFVVYTLERRERRLASDQIEQNYRMRVWYRASDGGALERGIGSRGVNGPLMYVKPRFNAPLDPGPPTADIFEPATNAAAPQTLPVDGPYKQIGAITVPVENDYRATFAACNATCYHLRLEPRRDPERNRLREMWVERESFRVTRFIATDRLYYGGTGVVVPERFDVTMDLVDGIPVVRSIRSRPDGFDPFGSSLDREDYDFTDVSFPPALPDWYFEPHTYRAHIAQAPDR